MEVSKKKNYYTFGMIKPNGIKYAEDILRVIYGSGLSLAYFECDTLDKTLINKDYDRELISECCFINGENYLKKTVLKMLIYDENGNAVNKYKETLKNIKDPNYKNLVYVSNDEVVALDEIIRFFGDDLFLIFEELKHSYCDYMSLMSQGVCPNYHKFIDDKVNRVLKHIDVYTKRIG